MIGRQLGKYKLVEAIGEGGMASVYKGYDESIDRYVAVKVLVTDANTDSNRATEMINRFNLEARTIAKLQHPHILPIHDYGVEGNILYLVMPYMAGGTLKDRIKDQSGLTLGEISEILKQIASAMDYAHSKEIIHRDIKPSNILIDEEGNALLADFGLVKIMTGSSTLTETGMMVGTPAYIAPEYASGQPITQGSDIYALGVSIYEAIIGKPPYGDTETHSPMQIALQHVMEPIPTISKHNESIPEGLDDVFAKVMAKNPEDRYETASDFAGAFQKAIQKKEKVVFDVAPAEDKRRETLHIEEAKVESSGQVSTSSSGGSSTSITLQFDNRGGLWIAAAAIILVVGILGIFALSQQNQPTNEVVDTGESSEDISTSPQLGEEEAAVAVEETAQFGQASFTTTGGLGDTLSLQVSDLRDAPDGTHYHVWMINTSSGDSLYIGQLGLDAMGNGTLTYNHPFGVFLPAVFNAVIITAEDEVQDTPTDEVVYYGSIPQAVTQALFNLLLSSEDGIQERGLLASAIAEAYLAQQQNQVQFTSMGSVLSYSEQTANALYGAEYDYNEDGRADNPGFGKGLIPVLDTMEGELDIILEFTEDSPRIQSNVEYIRTCISNTRTRVDEISSLRDTMISADDVDSISNQIDETMTTLDYVLNGFDMNENGRIEGFTGECGLAQISQFALLVGTMELQAGALPEESVVDFYEPYEFNSQNDFCIDDELTIGIAKNTNEHQGMDMGDA